MSGKRREPGRQARRLGEPTVMFTVSVAAQLSGMHPQTLRQYDRLGLVTPRRTAGRGRRYTAADVETLREIQRLSQEEGVNLAGIKRILELRGEVEQLRRTVDTLRHAADPGRRVFMADSTGDVVESARSRRTGGPRGEMAMVSGGRLVWRRREVAALLPGRASAALPASMSAAVVPRQAADAGARVL